MAQSEHAHDRTDRQPRGTAKYCAYCGTKLRDDSPRTAKRRVGARLLARTFCDADCENAWDIHAT